LIKHPDFVLRCKVEADSLSDIDFQAEKQDRMEYMGTITNYLKEILPTMQQDPLMGPFLMQLLQFSLAGFKVGKKFEGELDRTMAALQQKLAQPPQPPQPTPEEQMVQGKLQLMQAQGQQDAEQHQEDMAMKQQENAQKLDFKGKEMQLKLVGKQQEAGVKQQSASQKMVADRQKMVNDQQIQQQKTQNTIQTAGIQNQIAKQKMWRQQEQNALDFEQNAGMGGAMERGGTKAP
jgi:hypothetical protein